MTAKPKYIREPDLLDRLPFQSADLTQDGP